MAVSDTEGLLTTPVVSQLYTYPNFSPTKSMRFVLSPTLRSWGVTSARTFVGAVNNYPATFSTVRLSQFPISMRLRYFPVTTNPLIVTDVDIMHNGVSIDLFGCL